jgi:hypothetical protein
MAQAAGYPIGVALPQERAVNRLWGIPFVGMFVRAILAIPHMLVLLVLGIAMLIGLYIVWIPILLFGRVPSLWCTLVGELINRSTRVGAYVLLFPGGYPALGMGESGPVDVTVNVGDQSMNRLWGIPMIGLVARYIVLIPHLIILVVLGLVVYLATLVLWIPILINGRYADLAMRIVGMYLRYSARVTGYMAFLPIPYPPFEFE